jgi:flagellin-like protein
VVILIEQLQLDQSSDERGVTPTLSYIILLAVTVVLISLVLTSFSAFEETQTQQTTENEIDLILTNLTSELHYVDREANNSNYGSFTHTARATPKYIDRQGYSIAMEELSEPNQYEITISSDSPPYEASQVIYLESNLELDQGVVREDLQYDYDSSSNTITITSP